jgi:murein DD-endopeptidase MepM/ murein hydrolase activator NlpD
MLDGMGRDEMRAADADRQTVADRLKTALDEGRLDLHEYDERLQRAYAAKTYGDLDGLLTDLPNVAPPAVPAPPTVARSEHVTAEWLADVWKSWFSVVGITSAIWLVSSLSSGSVIYYWPVWVAVPWGVVLLWHTIAGLIGGEPRKLAAERERKELAKQRKRERKALEAQALEAQALEAQALEAQRLEDQAPTAQAPEAEATTLGEVPSKAKKQAS